MNYLIDEEVQINNKTFKISEEYITKSSVDRFPKFYKAVQNNIGKISITTGFLAATAGVVALGNSGASQETQTSIPMMMTFGVGYASILSYLAIDIASKAFSKYSEESMEITDSTSDRKIQQFITEKNGGLDTNNPRKIQAVSDTIRNLAKPRPMFA